MYKRILLPIISALLLCGCTAGNTSNDDTVISQAKKVNAYADEKICYGQGYETDSDNRRVGATAAQDKYGALGAKFIGDADNKTIYLTFDEGYENGCTARILDTLRDKGVSATFYVTMDYVNSSPELVKRMIDEGHEVGNHTCTHPSLPDVSDEQFFEEINKLEGYISDNFGGYRTVSLRPPRGEFSARTLTLAKNIGYETVLWSFAYNDWETDNQPDKDKAYDRITSATHNGAIYLLHAVSETNTAILADVIDYWLDNGYMVRSVSDR